MPKDSEVPFMFPNPLQMAMMGGALADALHEGREQSLERYAGQLEQQLGAYEETYRRLYEAYEATGAHAVKLEEENALRQQQIDELQESCLTIQQEFDAALRDFEALKASFEPAMQEYEKMKTGYQQMKKLLTDLFVTHADRILQPGAAGYREKILEFLKKLP